MRRARRMVLGVVLLGAALASCGGDDGTTGTTGTSRPTTVTPSVAPAVTSAAAATTSASTPGASAASTGPASTADAATSSPPAPIATSVPEGTTLRVADQYGLFAGVLGFAGLDQDIPYAVEYSRLTPGLVQLQAFRAGTADLGVVSPLGLVQAAAGGVDLHAVARWRTDFALAAIVTAPGVEHVRGWADLRGTRVAFQRDTASEALVLLGLDSVGLTLDDIHIVDIPQPQVGTVLQHGDADAGVTSEPFVSSYLTANPTAHYVMGIETPLAQSTLIVAADSTLEDPARAAAAAEYLTRLDQAFRELTADTASFIDLAVAVWNLDRAYLQEVLDGAEGVRMQGVPGDLALPYQRLTDLLAARGDLPADLDTAALFDPRFTSLFRS